MMNTLEITLPEPLKAFVEDKVATGNFGTASAYIEQLIREAQERDEEEALDESKWDQDHLEKLLLEGLDSGEPIPVNQEFWQERRARLAAHLARKTPDNTA